MKKLLSATVICAMIFLSIPYAGFASEEGSSEATMLEQKSTAGDTGEDARQFIDNMKAKEDLLKDKNSQGASDDVSAKSVKMLGSKIQQDDSNSMKNKVSKEQFQSLNGSTAQYNTNWTQYDTQSVYTSTCQGTDGNYVAAGMSVHNGVADIQLQKITSSGALSTSNYIYNTSYNYNYYTESIAPATDGGYYVLVGYDDVAGTYPQYDGMIVKINSSLSLQWSYNIDLSKNGYVNKIIQTADGGCLAIGSSYSSSYNVLAVKLTSGGSLSWSRTYGGTDKEIGKAVATTVDGGYIIASDWLSSNLWKPKFWKIDSYGNLITSSAIQTSYDKQVNDIIRDGGYFAFVGTCTISSYDKDLWYGKIDGGLTTIYFEKMDGFNTNDYGMSIALNNEGLYVLGCTIDMGSSSPNHIASLYFADPNTGYYLDAYTNDGIGYNTYCQNLIKCNNNSFICTSAVFDSSDNNFVQSKISNITRVSSVISTGVTLNKSNTTINVGNSETLIATVTPSNTTDKSLNWTTTNGAVATVDSTGKVTAVSNGTATITATTVDSGCSASCTVTVSTAVTGITLNKTATSITVGNSETLTATISPSSATNKTVTWSSNNLSAATVSSSGVVYGVAAGTATITVTTQDGGKTATCNVTVNPSTVSVSSVTLNKSATIITVGNSETLTATVNPSNATNKNVTWSSSNLSAATVSSSGVVYGVAQGTSTITVTTQDGGKTATCNVTVNPSTVSVSSVTLNKSVTTITAGNSETLTATVNPSNATNKNVTWSSSNLSAATVSSSGVVYGVAQGTSTITVTTQDGNKTATCTVTVNPGVTATLTVGSVTGRQGSMVDVPISISANSGLTNAIIDIVYNNSTLSPDSYSKGSILTGMATVNMSYATNKIRLVYADTNKINTAGNLIIISFRIADNATETLSPVTLNVSQLRTLDASSNPIDIASTVVPGGVTVKNYTLGDVDDNGLIDTQDAMSILLHVAGLKTIPSTQIQAADTYKDGVIDTQDAMRIMLYVAGMITSF